MKGSLFIRMANQGYNPEFLIFLMFIPLIVGALLSLYFYYSKKKSLEQVFNIDCYAAGLNMGWVTWGFGYTFVVAVLSAIIMFFIVKVNLKVYIKAVNARKLKKEQIDK